MTKKKNKGTAPESGEVLYHVPVMLREAVDGLAIQPDGIYVDATFGGGGHSRAILQQLGPGGRLLAFDQDADAQRNLPEDKRLVFVPHNFRHIGRFLRLHKITQINGLLADLGVSSHQFDEGERGFSIRFDAPLDMRMDTRQPLTAADILQTYTAERLHKMFEQYGEVTNARTLAQTIAELRKTHSLKTIRQFMQALQPVVKGNPYRYFAQVFQALRIEVNDELGALKEMLQQLKDILAPGGRVAIITFHSLEDRIVKQFFREGSFETAEPHNPFLQEKKQQWLKAVNKKTIVPAEKELKENPRARSARLRVAERV